MTPVAVAARMVLTTLALSVGTLSMRTVEAAQITADCRDARCEIFLSGAIERGDADKLAALLRGSKSGTALWNSVHLDSPGGDVDEALKITALVRRAMLYTQNADDALREVRGAAARAHGHTCASACFLILLAGANRFLLVDDGGGRVGFHRPFVDPAAGRAPAAAEAELEMLVRRLRDYLIAQGVPNRLVDEMISRPTGDMYWLKRDEVRRGIGLAPAWYEALVEERCPIRAGDAEIRADPETFARAVRQQGDCVRALRSRAQAQLRRSLAAES